MEMTKHHIEKRKLKINAHKYKIVVFEIGDLECEMIAGLRMERLQDFKYVGCFFTEDGEIEAEISLSIER